MRERMIFDLPADVVMAIKLRAVKLGATHGQVVEWAIKECFPDDVDQARREIEKQAEAS